MRGKLKKLFAEVLAVLLALSFSGCSELTGLDAQALMSPPKTTADREAIYALMGGGVGDVTLVYPKYGDYRSAIISRDVDGCGTSVQTATRAARGWNFLRKTRTVFGALWRGLPRRQRRWTRCFSVT